MFLKEAGYNLLVRRKPVIRFHYETYVDLLKKQQRRSRIKTWLVLLGMNFSYYILGDKTLHRYEHELKHIPYCKGCESSLSYKKTPQQLAEELSAYDVISFDVFDTLIFRPFLAPTDLFFQVGEKLDYLDFTALRAYHESEARRERFAKTGDYEIDIFDIYRRIEKYVGISAEKGIAAELDAELNMCYANPYMKIVYDLLKNLGKRIIITTDMYLPRKNIELILEKNGYDGYERIFLSNEEHKSKYDGELFKEVKRSCGDNLRYAHIGDNLKSDVQRAKENGFYAYHYPNVNHSGILYRAQGMSHIILAAYCGLVNARLHCGLERYSVKYEYGYVYAGLLVLGYCEYIHKLALEKNVDKVFFLARDGDILKRVYSMLFPEESTEYVYWSRFAAAKLGSYYYKSDFIRRFIIHKTGAHISVGDAVKSMEAPLLEQKIKLPRDTQLSEENAKKLTEIVYKNWDSLQKSYADEHIAAKRYLDEKTAGCNRVLAVDVGWAGSGAVIMSHLLNDKYDIPCEVIAVVAGTNSMSTAEPDMSESFLQSERMYSYCFSQSHNRELYKSHSPSLGDNIFFEMMLGSPAPQFRGFATDGSGYRLKFFEEETSEYDTVKEIHSGIIDFVTDYLAHFGAIPYMLNISGSDAYAPFLTATENNSQYLKFALGDCGFNALVGGDKKTAIKKQV